MRRLAIIDVAGGQQPVYNEDRMVAAVFNGEIYNFAELRAETALRGHRLVTDGHSECIPHLYEEYGGLAGRPPPRVRPRGLGCHAGAACCWRETAPARNPCTGAMTAGLVFRLELKALAVDPGLQPPGRPGRPAPLSYLSVRASACPFTRKVSKLPPGHILTWQDGKSEDHTGTGRCPHPARAVTRFRRPRSGCGNCCSRRPGSGW